MPKKELTALGGDTFAGLFTLGVKQAGFKVLATLEHSNYGAKTARLNHPEVTQHLKLAGESAWREAAEPYAGKVDFMYTQPPCAIWSAARGGVKGSWTSDPRLTWVPDLIDAGLIIRPKAWVWESVCNAWRHGRGYTLEQAQKWANAGYSVTIILEDAAYLGVPQHRPRMLLVAHQYPLVLPKVSHEAISVGQAFKGLRVKETEKQFLSPEWKELWEVAGKGKDLFHAFRLLSEEDQARHRAARENGKGASPSFLIKKLTADRPSKVILGGLKSLHPTEPRYLTLAEYYRLCGVPPEWQPSSGSLPTTTAELSRSVMPPVGRWLAEGVRDGLAMRKLSKPQYRLLDLRKPDAVYEEVLW